jgi:hypothetical protein
LWNGRSMAERKHDEVSSSRNADITLKKSFFLRASLRRSFFYEAQKRRIYRENNRHASCEF